MSYDPLPQRVDAVVIGSGILGASVAYNLADAGLSVAVVERGGFCGEASGANAGQINPTRRPPGLLSELCWRSAKLYPALSDRLGRNVHYDATGVLWVATTAQELDELRAWIATQQPDTTDVELLSAQQVHALEPTISPAVAGGAYSPYGGSIYPFAAVAAYLARAQEFGARLVGSTEVTGIITRDDQMTGVQTTRGSIQTGYAVNAGGAWAGQVSAMIGLHTPIIPIRGQLLATEPATGLPTRLIRGVGSVNMTWAGNGLVGSVREDAGFNKQVSLRHMRRLAVDTLARDPYLRDAQVIRAWTGLRPKTPDGLPILGESQRVKGFVLAAGAYDIGMLLGPAIGEVIRDVVLGRAPTIDISAANPDRFEGAKSKPARAHQSP